MMPHDHWQPGECETHGPILLWKGYGCPVCRATSRQGMAQAQRWKESCSRVALRDLFRGVDLLGNIAMVTTTNTWAELA